VLLLSEQAALGHCLTLFIYLLVLLPLTARGLQFHTWPWEDEIRTGTVGRAAMPFGRVCVCVCVCVCVWCTLVCEGWSLSHQDANTLARSPGCWAQETLRDRL
jgi:hypothetical protein